MFLLHFFIDDNRQVQVFISNYFILSMKKPVFLSVSQNNYPFTYSSFIHRSKASKMAMFLRTLLNNIWNRIIKHIQNKCFFLVYTYEEGKNNNNKLCCRIFFCQKLIAFFLLFIQMSRFSNLFVIVAFASCYVDSHLMAYFDRLMTFFVYYYHIATTK